MKAKDQDECHGCEAEGECLHGGCEEDPEVTTQDLLKSLKEKSRPSWDDIWMGMAHQIAKRSIDPRLQVGCIVVSEDNTQVLAVGYNGDHAGGPNLVDSKEPGQSGFIHAEENALIKLDYNHPKKKVMYLTTMPCLMCAKKIINAGIDEVVFDKDYRNTSGYDLLKKWEVSSKIVKNRNPIKIRKYQEK